MIGKIGTDIQDNKCSWLVVQALQRAQAPQLTVLKARARPPARSHALPCMLLRLPAPPAVRDGMVWLQQEAAPQVCAAKGWIIL